MTVFQLDNELYPERTIPLVCITIVSLRYHSLFDNLTSCCCSDYMSLYDTKEQRQCLCCRNQEDAHTNHHHNLLFQILLITCSHLIINTDFEYKMTKETN